ncbi:DUF7193 family protein, partial [Escherichia coli]
MPLNRWKKLSTCVNGFSTWMLVYNENGVTIPSEYVYFYRTSSGMVYMAIPQSDRYSWLEEDICYLRIYP